MLNSVKWEYFKLEDLFEIKKLSNTISKKAESCVSNTRDNTIAYVTRSVNNNGVNFFCNKDLIKKEDIKIFEKNAIIIGGESTECFYIENPFITGNNISILTNDHLNSYTGLFISTIIDKEFYRYSYGRGFTMTRIKSTSIKLPVDSNGDPNWEFMEDYMKKISKGNLEGFNLPKNDKRLKLDEREWDEFKLEDLFEIERGKQNYISKMSSGPYPYISATEQNNGVSGFVDKYTNEGGVITLNYDGSIGEAFYQPSKFCSSEKIAIIRLKIDKELTKELSLFLITILKREKYRYGYGRKWSIQSRLKPTIIKLPIKPKSSPEEKSEPDWEFMENYIKGLPYTNKL